LDLLSLLRNQRLQKLESLQEQGVLPYAYSYDRTHTAEEIVSEYKEGMDASAAGRIMSLRKMGKASFAHIMDASGRVQIYVKQDNVGEDAYKVFKNLDLGDIIGVKGQVFKTRTGEITLLVNELKLLAKSLRPLPVVKEQIKDDEKIVYDAFADKELRYRQRYVDLIVNSDVRKVFEARSKIVSEMRRYLEDRGYIEVETPVLQPIYGGANARPFVTHHNTLDMTFYLRIADELYLKRLIVGGFEGVFEISKDFRNEGMDRDHNPEFTMMELYVAYKDYEFMMDLVEDMVWKISKKVFGKESVEVEGKEINFKPPWKRMTYLGAIKEYTGYDLYGKSIEDIREIAKKLNVDIEEGAGRGKIFDEIFSVYVEPKLIEPTIIKDFPIEISPLAKKHRKMEGLTERFEGFVLGKELCNSFSELNDPIDQRQRFEAQAKLKAEGDEEAMVIDEDYIRALEYGMPPTAGLGIGVDRLVMFLSGEPSIRDVILFPQMRPERGNKKEGQESK